MNETINTLLEASPPLILALAINLLLYALKRTPWPPDWALPMIAMAVGALVYPFIADIAKQVPTVKSPLVYNIVLGSAIGGMSVALNQQFRQILGLKTSNTEFITKPKTKDPNRPNLDGQDFSPRKP
jgi:hypothetical protein